MIAPRNSGALSTSRLHRRSTNAKRSEVVVELMRESADLAADRLLVLEAEALEMVFGADANAFTLCARAVQKIGFGILKNLLRQRPPNSSTPSRSG